MPLGEHIAPAVAQKERSCYFTAMPAIARTATVRAATPKGAATREAIIDRAHAIARADGLEGLSIGGLAAAVGMSKSGVFTHFGSREDLQLAVLDAAADEFTRDVMAPAFQAPRGVARLRAIHTRWVDWLRRDDGACVMISAAGEYDDRPGSLRERAVFHLQRLRSTLARSVRMCVESGELRAETDASQVAFELYGIVLACNHDARLFGRADASVRASEAFERLLTAYRSMPAA
jgi:AcrR family transcriptional regulator